MFVDKEDDQLQGLRHRLSYVSFASYRALPGPLLQDKRILTNRMEQVLKSKRSRYKAYQKPS